MNNKSRSFFTSDWRIFRVGFLSAVSACAVANQLNPIAGVVSVEPKQPPVEVVGPDSAFTIQTPRLLTPGANVRISRDKSGTWYAAFTDDLCREFSVEAWPADSTVGVEQWVRTKAVPGLEEQGATRLVARTDTVENIGAASFVTYRFPKGAPCRMEENGGGLVYRRKATPLDVDVAYYTFRRGSRMFIVKYGRGILEDSTTQLNRDVTFGIRVGPAEAVVRTFVAGISFRH